jgi:plasmid stability protein
MAQLIVRKLSPKIVAALRKRAAAHGRSAEAEHREILRAALLDEREGEKFKQLLLRIPNVGEDGDFARIEGEPRDVAW